jgi:hypothetical protein
MMPWDGDALCRRYAIRFVYLACHVHSPLFGNYVVDHQYYRLLLVLLLYAGLRYGESGSQRWLWVAGLAIDLACLVRENHGLLAVPTTLWVWDCDAARGRRRLRRLLNALLLAAAVVLPILPCTVRNYAVSGELVPVTAGGGAAIA